MPRASETGKRSSFERLLTRLARVPKHEIDEQERKYQDARKTNQPAKPGTIATRTKRTA